jgi:hypothetical protein
MNIDPNVITVVGIAFWLGGSFAFIGVVHDWSHDRRTQLDRRRRLAELGELGD